MMMLLIGCPANVFILVFLGMYGSNEKVSNTFARTYVYNTPQDRGQRKFAVDNARARRARDIR